MRREFWVHEEASRGGGAFSTDRGIRIQQLFGPDPYSEILIRIHKGEKRIN